MRVGQIHGGAALHRHVGMRDGTLQGQRRRQQVHVGRVPGRHLVRQEAKVVVLCDSEKVALPGPPEQHVVEDQGLEQVTRVWVGEGSSKRIRGAARTVLNFAHATRFEGKKKEKKQ